MSEKNRQFDSFEQWTQQAMSWLSGNGLGRRAACYDAKGRPCRTEEDFLRARAEDAFPVQWVAPDQAVARLRPPPPAPPGWHDSAIHHPHNGAPLSAQPLAPVQSSRFAQEEENRRNQNNMWTKAAALGAIHALSGQKAEARPRHSSEPANSSSEEHDTDLAEILVHALESLHAGGAIAGGAATVSGPTADGAALHADGAFPGHGATATPGDSSLLAQAHAHNAKFAPTPGESEEGKPARQAALNSSSSEKKEVAREEEPENEEGEEKEDHHEEHRHGDAARERREREEKEARERRKREEEEARARREAEEQEREKRRELEERAREAARRAEISHFEAFADPKELSVDIMAVGADGAPVLLAHSDTMTSGVLAAHEIATLTGQPCRFVDPDLGEILPGDPVPENVTTWIEMRLSPAPAYATPFDMEAPTPFA